MLVRTRLYTYTREWSEFASLYSTNMAGIYSGGLVHEYTIEPNGYCLVKVGNGGNNMPNTDFDRLKRANEATDNPTGDGGYKQNDSAS